MTVSGIVTSFSGLTGDLTLHANWAANLYYVTFVQAETGIEIGTRLGFGVNSTDDVVISPAAIDGYRFEGWYTDAACTTEFYQSNGVYVLRRGAYNDSFTLYAKTTPVYTLYLAREDTQGLATLQFAEGEDRVQAGEGEVRRGADHEGQRAALVGGGCALG